MAKRKKSDKSSHGSLVIGRNAVREVLRHRSDRALRLLIASGEQSAVLAEILSLAEKNQLEIAEIEKDSLERMAHSGSHQGVAVEMKPREFLTVKEVISKLEVKERSLVLALDGVLDPQNVGAIMRAAECLGVDAILWSKNRGPSITPVVSKVSVGASELLTLLPVSNLAQGLKSFQDAGFWTVATVIGENAKSLDAFEWPERSLIIVGAEGSGVRDRTARESDFQVYIPMAGRVDSLNVSQATTLLLYACRSFHARR